MTEISEVSFMRAIRGDTTRVVPPSTLAANWNVNDFPAPVGMMPMQSLPVTTASMPALRAMRQGGPGNRCRATSSNSIASLYSPKCR